MLQDIIGVPLQCSCGNHSDQRPLPWGLTHPKGADCAFFDNFDPLGFVEKFGTCCMMALEGVAYDLDHLKEHALARQVRVRKSAEGALELAASLEEVAKRVVAGDYDTILCGNDDPKEKWQNRDQYLGSLLHFASWYRRLGILGFGVEVTHLPLLRYEPPSPLRGE